MEIEEDAIRVRIYLGEADRHGGEALYKVIVHRLREAGVWGATVFRGLYGYGRKSVLHASSPLRLSTDLPVVVEAVDAERKLAPVLDDLADLVKEGLITTEPVTVLHHVGEPGEGPTAEPGEREE